MDYTLDREDVLANDGVVIRMLPSSSVVFLWGSLIYADTSNEL